MTTFDVPTSVVYPTTGEIIPLPGHASYVAGTDITDAFNYWLWSSNGGIGSDGYQAMSGSSSGSPNTIRFQAGLTYWFEYGTTWGRRVKAKFTDRAGRLWPQIPLHAFKHLIIDGNGATWTQDDPTVYDDGIRAVTVTTTAGSSTVTLSSSIGQTLIDRWTTGGATLQSGYPSAKVFNGNVRGSTVTAISSDGLTLTVSTPALLSVTGQAGVMYFAARETRRNNRLWMFATEAPGLWAGVERGCIHQDIKVRNLRIKMTNTSYQTSVFTEREGWHGVALRGISGIEFESTVSLTEIWGDALNLSPAGQVGDTDVGLMVEGLTFRGRVNGCGRHFLTGQGDIDTHIVGAYGKNIGRLVYDCEATSTAARMLNTKFENSTFEPGTLLWHIGPATVNGDPGLSASCSTVSGSNLLTIPYDYVTQDEIGCSVTGTGIPSGTYIRKRLSATSIEMSANATATGTTTVVFGQPVQFRDFAFINCSTWATQANICGNYGVQSSKAYFTATVDATNVLHDVQFETRADGRTFTGTDLAGVTVNAVQPGLVVRGVPSSTTSTTVTMPSAATLTTGADATLTLSSTAGSRILTAAKPYPFTDGNPAWKGRAVTGPNIPSGVTIDTTANSQITLSLPATSTGSFSYTISGRSRFWAAIVPEEWTGFTVDRLRNISSGVWGGSGPAWGAANQPNVMIPRRWDNVSITKCYLPVGLRSGLVGRYMVGAYNGSLFDYGAPGGTIGSWTQTNNRGPNAVDNQVSDPSVTATVVLQTSTTTGASPTLTATTTFSDARTEEGSAVVFFRNGNASVAVPMNSSNVATFPVFAPLGTGIHVWTAKWFPSWDTNASATSNAVTVNVGNVTPTSTSTVLGVSPSSPQNLGTTVTLTATVTPDPGAGTVTFTDAGGPLGTVDLASGVASLDVDLVAGDHPLVASFDGYGAYTGSSSSTTTYTINAAVDTTQPTVVSVSPDTGAVNVDRATTITVTFSESVTDVVMHLRRGTFEVACDMTTLSGTQVQCIPAGQLAASATYTVIVDDAVDTSGNHLAGRFSSQFTTADSHELIAQGLLVPA